MEVKCGGNTTNLRNGLTDEQMKLQQTLQIPANFACSVKTIEEIAGFICKDMRPYSVVENEGFRRQMKVTKLHYIMVSRKRLSEEIIPNMYRLVKENVKSKLQLAERVGITSDTWTSGAMESYECDNALHRRGVEPHLVRTTDHNS